MKLLHKCFPNTTRTRNVSDFYYDQLELVLLSWDGDVQEIFHSTKVRFRKNKGSVRQISSSSSIAPQLRNRGAKEMLEMLELTRLKDCCKENSK